MDATVEVEPKAHPWRLLLCFLFVFFAVCAAAVALPHDPYIRYQQLSRTLQFRTVWSYERLEFDRTPIDIAVIGNSRLSVGVSAPILGQRLSMALGRPIHVVNLSAPQEGVDIQYVIAKRLFAAHPEVKLVILSAIEQPPRDSHPAFRSIADPLDIIQAPLLVNRSYFNNLAYLPYRQISLFVQSLWPEAFGLHRAFDRAHYVGADLDTTKSFTNPEGDFVNRDVIIAPDALLAAADDRIGGITPPLLPVSASAYEFAIAHTYPDRIARLAKQKNARLAFLYLPIFSYEGPFWDKGFYQGLGPVLDGGLLAKDSRNYSDYGHANRIGSAWITEWLGQRLVTNGLIGPRSPGGGA